jgi:hypothetical protein
MKIIKKIKTKKTLQNFVCEVCGNEFQSRASHSRFCSKKCKEGEN